jgi:hypothetical protein
MDLMSPERLRLHRTHGEFECQADEALIGMPSCSALGRTDRWMSIDDFPLDRLFFVCSTLLLAILYFAYRKNRAMNAFRQIDDVWENARQAPPEFKLYNLSCPMVVMRFHLVYNGPLPASGNSSKPKWAAQIRDAFHSQLEYLWQVHTALQRLRQTAIVKTNPERYLGVVDSPLGVERDVDSYPATEDETDLCAPIIHGDQSYIPLVRKSLDLNCYLNIQLLRQEDPGSLVLQGGDVDGRLKTLFDALRKPDNDVANRYPQAQNRTYCLLESDALIAGFDVSTDRLLFPQTPRQNEVHLVIEVIVRVLKVESWNVCLLGN